MSSLLLAFEVFDDIAFFYLALAVCAVAVLPWSAFRLYWALHGLLVKPQLVPLTRIQKLKRAAALSGAAGAGKAPAVGAGGTLTVQPAGGALAASGSESALSK